MTKAEILARISELSREANDLEDELCLIENELDQLYEELELMEQ